MGGDGCSAEMLVYGNELLIKLFKKPNRLCFTKLH